MRSVPQLQLLLLAASLIAAQAPAPPVPGSSKQFVYPEQDAPPMVPAKPVTQPPPSPQPKDVTPPAPEPAKAVPGEKATIVGQVSVPAYKPVKLQLGNATPPVTWLVVTWMDNQLQTVDPILEDASNLVFVGPPGQYLVVATSSGNTHTQTQVTIQPPADGPTPAPSPTPTPITPPQPAPDPGGGGFVYPPGQMPGSGNGPSDFSGGYAEFSSALARILATVPDKQRLTWESKRNAELFRALASKIELDADRRPPLLQTVEDARSLVKREELAFLAGTRLRPVKQAYPEAYAMIQKGFYDATANVADKVRMTPEMRQIYVAYLRAMADGFSKVSN